MAKTLAQQLEAVQTAMTYPSLEVLYAREERLLRLGANATPMEQRVAEF